MKKIGLVTVSILTSSMVLLTILGYLTYMLISQRELMRWAIADQEYKYKLAAGILGLGICLGLWVFIKLSGQALILYLIINCIVGISVENVLRNSSGQE